MKFRSKLQDFKARLSDRKMYSIVIVIFAVVAMWGFYQYKRASNFRQELDNQYNRAFFDTVGYVQNVESLLVKSLISNTPSKTTLTLKELWRQANLAQENIGLLPVSQPVLQNTSKFLTQVGDLSYTLSSQNLNGKPINNDQYKILQDLDGYAVSLKDSLINLQDSITTGRIKWGELSRKGNVVFGKENSENQMEEFRNVDKAFLEYPSLIYDGPFSDHITDVEPVGLTGEEINMEQAKDIVKNFFKNNQIKEIQDAGTTDNPPMSTYNFNVLFNDNEEGYDASISITQKGGHVVWMLYNKQTGEPQIDIDTAKQKASDFLKQNGLENMIDTYFLKEDGTATINYAYLQDDIVVYSDLIKVKISLDDGQIVGFESKGYIYSHKEREIPEDSISFEEARNSISNKLSIISEGRAIIPTDYKTEILTYEYKGILNEREFLIYVNAQTGHEEKILMIINTPEGVLTM